MFFGSAMVDHTSEKLKHVAFSVIIAVAVLTALGSVIISSVSTEGFEINEVTFKKGSNTEAVLLVSIKNLGNSQISDISVTIDGLNLSGTVTPVVLATQTAASATAEDKAGEIIAVNGDITSLTASSTVSITSITYRIHANSLDVGDIASIAVKIPGSGSILAGSSYTITVEANAGGIVTTGTLGGFDTTDGTQTFQTAIAHITRI